MPRPRSFDPDTLADAALTQFWQRGYCATSMDDLVSATGVSRYGIYAAFGDKHGLYLACFARYRENVVTPAFLRVEAPGAGLPEIAGYFEHQIAAAEGVGLPGPGCFVANAATETAPHDPGAAAEVAAHNDRLRAGFARALETAGHRDPALPEALLTFATGLWSLSRVTGDAGPLRKAVASFLALLERAG